MDDLQRLIDRLARELDRGVMLEDRRQRLIAHSVHTDTDPLRREAILHRQSPKAVRDWLHSLGVDSFVAWQRIPANPALGMEPRVCVPVRFQESLLGHLWIIEVDKMAQDELVLAGQAAEQAAAILYRTRLVLQVESAQEREGLRDLLSDSEAVRRQAGIHMVEADLIRPHASVSVVVCSSVDEDMEFDDVQRAQLDGCLHTVRTTVDRRDLLYLIRPNHALCLVSTTRAGSTRYIELVAERLQSEMQRTFVDSKSAPMVTTVGGIKTGLDQAWSSYDEALRTVRILRAFPSLGEVASWEGLGVYRLLSSVASSEIDVHLLHPGVVALMGSKEANERLRLLEVYLDANADAGRAAEIMEIHRTSVYYRLARIEEVMGVSLSDGLEKLGIHMSVKLLRLAALAGNTPRVS